MLRTLSPILGIMLLVSACGETLQNASLTAPGPAQPPAPRTWMVFFDTNSTALSEQSNATVGAAAGIAKSSANARVTVTGYTDTEGAVAYNQALSVRRAASVKDALVRNGVAPQAISVVGEGERGQFVPTGDQVKYPSNRRVGIVVQ
jgi:outer membrane protein OmpA-like peptidoglycan-associated protein